MLQLSLLAEGGSDIVLKEPISWLLERNPFVGDFDVNRTDFGVLPNPPSTLSERVVRTFELDAPDILLIHRDNDGKPVGVREEEIRRACQEFSSCVPIVPVTMSETWFLFDERSLRKAAGSTDTSIVLDLPKLHKLESIKRPKALLQSNLRTASGLTGARLSKFNWRAAYHRLARTIPDYEPLFELPSFARMSDALDAVLQVELGGNP